jgi:biotin operon repressor
MQRKSLEKLIQTLRQHGAGLSSTEGRLVIEGLAPPDILLQAHRHRRALAAMVRTRP